MTSAAAVTVLGFPTDCNSSYLRGPAKAPAQIRRAIANEGANPFAESELNLNTTGVYEDLGDVALAESAADVATIESAVAVQLTAGKRVLSYGGDHSVTYPIIRAYAKRYPDLSIVHFDAHPDLYPVFGGNRLSHACPFARILEDTTVKNLTQIGVRTMSLKQREVADRYGVRVFRPSQLASAKPSLPAGPVYLTLDLDGLDPAFAPGVSHREPGGLSVREILEIVEAIPGRIVGADIVELNPDEDISGMTATVAAKFAKEFIARMFADAGP
ncbi:MAG: agmatinase [Vulcanimicrobiaceae bacterium]